MTSSGGIEVGEKSEEGATIHIELGFFDGEYSDPTNSDVEELVCTTNSFLQEKVEEFVDDDGIQVHAAAIDWTLGEPFSLAFVIQATFGDGTTLTANKVFEALKLGDSDVRDYLENYVMQSSPKGVFAGANEVSLKVNMDKGASLSQMKLAIATCQGSDGEKGNGGFDVPIQNC